MLGWNVLLGELDITKKIKIIEQLKSRLLSDVSDIYSNMASDDSRGEENIDLLADMIIITYFLSDQLGVSYAGLEMKAKNKLKIALLQEDEHSTWRNELASLVRYFDYK